jgi:lysophospholipid acyltransferase (LPLAT)-like uncharacterized protein
MEGERTKTHIKPKYQGNGKKKAYTQGEGKRVSFWHGKHLSPLYSYPITKLYK